MENLRVETACPKCGHVQKRNINMGYIFTIERELCDPDEGGCDSYYFVEYKIEVKTTVFDRVEK